MRKHNLGQALDVIAGLIEGQRIAEPGRYKVVWIKDHTEIRKNNKPDKESFLIIILTSQDINEGLTAEKWDIITGRVGTLIETGVIK